MSWFGRLAGRRIVAVVLAVVVLSVGAGAAAYATLRDRGLADDVAFRWGGTSVTRGALDQRIQVLAALYGVKEPDAASADRDEFERAAAKSMAVNLIVTREARDRGIVIADKAASDQLDKLIDAQMTGGRDAFVQFLAQAGISEDDVLAEIKDRMATARLVEEVTADIPAVTVDEARAAYDERRDAMVTPETRHLLNIVVASKADAARVLRAAQSGEDFGRLARIWSRDGSTRSKGGDLGVVSADQVEADYATAAFGAPQGGLFGPVKTRYGWNVGRVVTINRPRQLSFAEVESQVRQALLEQRQVAEWTDYVGGLLRSADVEYADDLRPKDPDTPPSPTAG